RPTFALDLIGVDRETGHEQSELIGTWRIARHAWWRREAVFTVWHNRIVPLAQGNFDTDIVGQLPEPFHGHHHLAPFGAVANDCFAQTKAQSSWRKGLDADGRIEATPQLDLGAHL